MDTTKLTEQQRRNLTEMARKDANRRAWEAAIADAAKAIGNPQHVRTAEFWK